MATTRADRLTEFLESRAGTHLRTVIRYDEEEYALKYLRDDIAEPDFLQRMEEVLANLTRARPSRDQKLNEEFGPKRASLQVRDEGVILHFATNGRSGILVSLEAGAARQLDTFVKDCLRRIER